LKTTAYFEYIMITLLIIILGLITLLFGDDIILSSNINLWIVILMLGYKIFKDRYVSTISMFIFGFIYIFYKEFLNDSLDLTLDWGKQNVIIGYYVIMFSFISVLVGFHCRELLRNHKNPIIDQSDISSFIKRRFLFFNINIFLIVVIFSGNIYLIFEGLTEGRPNAFKYGILSSFSYAISVIVIVNLKLYYKQYYGKDHYLKILFWTSPLFILLVASGARFLLLYGIIALISDKLYTLTNRKIIRMSIFLILFGLLSNQILEFRNEGFLNNKIQELRETQSTSSFTINQQIVNKLTNEGMLRNASMISDYTSKNGYTYGQSIGFLAYWWVPRGVWKEKPTQLDFWLIREYTSEYSDSGYSTASGFFGELYMDFGKYFLMPFLFGLGYLLSYLNSILILNKTSLTYDRYVISNSILAWVFFSVRSLMTSTFLLIFVMLSAYLISKYFKKWKIIS
jgi:hypothetical protein